MSHKFRMSIDPGLHSCGVAVWEGGAAWKRKRVPDEVIVYKEKDWYGHWGKEYLEDRCREMAYKIYDHLTISCEAVYIEVPHFMGGEGGMISARRGDTLKLAMLVGTINGLFVPNDVVFVPVREWKGQLPKEVVQRRVQKIVGPGTCKRLNIHTDGWDAVGLGLAMKGMFTR